MQACGPVAVGPREDGADLSVPEDVEPRLVVRRERALDGLVETPQVGRGDHDEGADQQARELVDLVVAQDERREQLHHRRVVVREHREDPGIDARLRREDPRTDVGPLQTHEQPSPSDLARDRRELLLEAQTDVLDAVEEAGLLDDVEDLRGDDASEVRSTVRRDVHERLVVVEAVYGRRHQGRSDRVDAATETLAGDDDVWLDTVVLVAPHPTAAAEARLHLVEHEQHAALTAQSLDPREVSLGWHRHPERRRDRLEDDRGRLVADRAIHRGEIGVVDVHEAGQPQLVRLVVRRVGRHRGECGVAVVRPVDRDDLRASAHGERGLDRDFDGLGT